VLLLLLRLLLLWLLLPVCYKARQVGESETHQVKQKRAPPHTFSLPFELEGLLLVHQGVWGKSRATLNWESRCPFFFSQF